MDPQDDAPPPSRRRPSARQLARTALRPARSRLSRARSRLARRAPLRQLIGELAQEGRARLSEDWSRFQDTLRHGPSTAFVSAAEHVVIDSRRHPVLLVAPALRTLTGLLVLVVGLSLVPLLVFAATTAAWARARRRSGLRATATVAGGCCLALAVLPGLIGMFWTVVLLLGWLAEDVADWHSDRLIVTDKRLYRRHGVLTRHSPSMSLMGIAFIDAAVPPLGWALRYGTLQLDSAAQQDAPLSRFDLVPHVVPVLHEILRLRSAAMPRYPQQPV